MFKSEVAKKKKEKSNSCLATARSGRSKESNKSPHIPPHFVTQKGDQYSSSLKQLEASAMKTGTIWNVEK
jgi:hypothetical protein